MDNRRRNNILVVAIIVGIFVIWGIASLSETPVGAVGQKVTDRDWSIALYKIERQSSLKGLFDRPVFPDGQFLVAYVEAQNVGSQPRTIRNEDVKFISDGYSYEPVRPATLMEVDDWKVFFLIVKVQPQLKERMVIIFDIPRGATGVINISGTKFRID